MASVFKVGKAKQYTVVWTDWIGKKPKRRKVAGYTDKRESQRYGDKLETEVRQDSRRLSRSKRASVCRSC